MKGTTEKCILILDLDHFSVVHFKCSFLIKSLFLFQTTQDQKMQIQPYFQLRRVLTTLPPHQQKTANAQHVMRHVLVYLTVRSVSTILHSIKHGSIA